MQSKYLFFLKHNRRLRYNLIFFKRFTLNAHYFLVENRWNFIDILPIVDVGRAYFFSWIS